MKTPTPALVLLGLLALGGCTSTPPSRFYTLAAGTASASASASTAAAPAAAVVIAPVSVPELLDRPQIVRRVAPQRVVLEEFDLWAQPLKLEVSRVLAATLAAAWPQARIDEASLALPQADAGRLFVGVQRFEADEREAVVELAWRWVPPAPAAAQRGSSRGSAALAAGAEAAAPLDAAVAALSRALAEAGADLARQLSAAPAAPR